MSEVFLLLKSCVTKHQELLLNLLKENCISAVGLKYDYTLDGYIGSVCVNGITGMYFVTTDDSKLLSLVNVNKKENYIVYNGEFWQVHNLTERFSYIILKDIPHIIEIEETGECFVRPARKPTDSGKQLGYYLGRLPVNVLNGSILDLHTYVSTRVQLS